MLGLHGSGSSGGSGTIDDISQQDRRPISADIWTTVTYNLQDDRLRRPNGRLDATLLNEGETDFATKLTNVGDTLDARTDNNSGK
jgi:hypothetical protein